jgi:hypothetical protein
MGLLEEGPDLSHCRYRGWRKKPSSTALHSTEKDVQALFESFILAVIILESIT